MSLRILRFKRIASTQDTARRLAERGAPSWTVVLADRQRRGRGRMERSWSSGAGGLYLSVILRPRAAPADLARWSLLCGQACAAALQKASGLKTVVSPPNDIFASAPGSPTGAYKKVCGILLEASGDTKNVDWLIAGIGINVDNRLPKTLERASSLRTLLGRRRRISKGTILKAVIKELRLRSKKELWQDC
ncbi:MAG: biotin--[acetyl-CoA-carboxylase] ligase [Elusimicrobiota bacterium]|jgi:BirA family biotin operon repressor/biotin-[acetyl-CoA-carboxylase] ligase